MPLLNQLLKVSYLVNLFFDLFFWAASVAFFVVGFLLGMALQQKAARLQGTRRAEQGEVLHF